MPTNHARLRELFIAVCDLPPHEQSALIESSCAGEPELRAELESLLERDRSKRGVLSDDDVVAGIRVQCDNPPEPPMPQHIGRYSIKKLLGAGGMGVVWLATQENPRRDVAVKVVRPGLMNRELQRRFELEAAVLGRLQHPGIAQIYEAGMFDDSAGARPYFAMEHVSGIPLLEYLHQRTPDRRQCLELFASICDAVHHAHQKGIVHRDLKPGNILVSSDGTPKILDFGVARAIDSDLQTTTMQTGIGQLVGTLHYMSPEQVHGDARAVDIRSDVYALGVILYQMLTGRLPYELADRAIATAARVIAETEPTPPSAINRTLRGDLNTIVLKALEKDPALRYQSASDVAADVRRHLHDQPIVARPASAYYHFRKFARRNKGLVAGFALTLLALVAGIVGTGAGLMQAQDQRDQAQRQSRIAEAVNQFLNHDLLANADPYRRGGNDVKFRDILDEAADAVDSRFLDEPEIEASIRSTIGQAYFGMGDYPAAERHLRRAVDLYEALGDFDNLLKARIALVRPILFDWHLDEAEQLASQNVELAQRRHGMHHLQTAQAFEQQAIVFKRRSRYEPAEQAYRTALDIYQHIAFGRNLTLEEQRGWIITKNNLAVLYSEIKRLDEAEALLREVVADWERLRGRRHADTAYAMNNLGDALWRQEKLEDAEIVWREALDIRREVLGADHPDTYFSLYSIGLIESDTGRFEQAEATFRVVLAARERLLDPSNRDVLNTYNALGVALERMGRVEEAAATFGEALRRSYLVFDPEYRSPRLYRGNVLKCLRTLGAQDQMAEVYREYFQHLEASLASGKLEGLEWANRANTLAWKLLTCEAVDERNPEKALHWAQQAEKIDKSNSQILDTLAHALAENGRLDEALLTQRRAIDILPADAPQKTRQALIEYFEQLSKQNALHFQGDQISELPIVSP